MDLVDYIGWCKDKNLRRGRPLLISFEGELPENPLSDDVIYQDKINDRFYKYMGPPWNEWQEIISTEMDFIECVTQNNEIALVDGNALKAAECSTLIDVPPLPASY